MKKNKVAKKFITKEQMEKAFDDLWKQDGMSARVMMEEWYERKRKEKFGGE